MFSFFPTCQDVSVLVAARKTITDDDEIKKRSGLRGKQAAFFGECLDIYKKIYVCSVGVFCPDGEQTVQQGAV